MEVSKKNIYTGSEQEIISASKTATAEAKVSNTKAKTKAKAKAKAHADAKAKAGVKAKAKAKAKTASADKCPESTCSPDAHEVDDNLCSDYVNDCPRKVELTKHHLDKDGNHVYVTWVNGVKHVEVIEPNNKNAQSIKWLSEDYHKEKKANRNYYDRVYEVDHSTDEKYGKTYTTPIELPSISRKDEFNISTREDDIHDQAFPDSTPETEFDLLLKEIERFVLECPKEQQEFIRVYYGTREKTKEEIARESGVTKQAIDNRDKKIKNNCRKIIDAYINGLSEDSRNALRNEAKKRGMKLFADSYS